MISWEEKTHLEKTSTLINYDTLFMESPVPMAVYYTGQRLLLRTNNGHVMTTLKDISSTVFNLQEINIPFYGILTITWITQVLNR